MRHMPYALRLTRLHPHSSNWNIEAYTPTRAIGTPHAYANQSKTTYPCFHMSNPVVNIILINLKLGSCIKGVKI